MKRSRNWYPGVERRGRVNASISPVNETWLRALGKHVPGGMSAMVDDVVTAAREGRKFSPPMPGVIGQSRSPVGDRSPDAAAQSGNVGSRTRQTEEE